MKIACIGINNNLINSSEQIKIINFITKKLYEIGESVSLISYFDNNYNALKDIYNSKYDMIFVIGTQSSIYNHNIKDNLARIFGDKLVNNEASYTALKYYCNVNNIVFSVQEETEVELPENSIPLCDKNYYYNGFMYHYNQSYTIYLPDILDFVETNYYQYILPLINDLISIKKEYVAFKCFGILEKDIRNILSEYMNSQDIDIQIISDNLDSAIYIRYDSNVNHSYIQNKISDICSVLNKYIYSTEDRDIYQVAVDMLKLQNKKIAISETITLGEVTQKLSLCNPDIIAHSFVYNNYDNIISSTGIDKKVIDKFGKFSVNSVYELTNSILSNYNCDLGLFLLSDINKKDICYIAVGDLDGIHVYKNKLSGSTVQIIETLSKTAIFYLIKKLKQNDLHFI